MAQIQSYDIGFGSGGQNLNREDLLDIIVNIAPWDTPLFSSCPKTTTKHTTHEWIEDSLGTASAAVEGAAFSAGTIQTRSRKLNWTMIFRKDIEISNTQQVLNPAGISNEYSYQIEVAMKEIARGIETRLFASAAESSASGGSGRLMRVLDYFITSNTASGTDVGGKTMLDSLIELCFSAGGTPSRIYCHPNTKSKFAAALGTQGTGIVNYRNIAASDARIVGNVDVYVSNFGVVEFVPDRFVPTAGATTGYGRYWLLEQPKVRVAFLRPIKHVPLPPNGDSVRGMVLGELTLEVMAQSAHAKAINITAG